MIDRQRSAIGRVLAACLVLVATSAGAQEVSDEAPAGSGSVEAVPGDVEAIEIIGERIDVTDVQDEAQAITAFSATLEFIHVP